MSAELNYELVVGLEVHAQLKTKSKIFCSCLTAFGQAPNSAVCPTCLGLPGALPVLNRRVVDFAMKAGIAIGADINEESIFERKNYFYPDLPKGYQISQYAKPLASGGELKVLHGGQVVSVKVNRIHLEEDAGKLLHDEPGQPEGHTLVDLNRCGIPLIEIVSEPVIHSSKLAGDYLRSWRLLLLYLGICDGNMQEGSLRCDANISLRLKSSNRLGTRTEIKNLNSFKHVESAIEYEYSRQLKLLKGGGSVVQETRLWDAKAGKTVELRSKEEALDYRYFPDPDLTPLYVDSLWVDRVKAEQPKLPLEWREKLIQVHCLGLQEADQLIDSPALLEIFQTITNTYKDSTKVSNWLLGEFSRHLNRTGQGVEQAKVKPSQIVDLLQLIDEGRISQKIGKDVFEEMFESGMDPEAIIMDRGLEQISDEAGLRRMVLEVIEQNKDQVESYKAGKDKLFGYFVGQIMKRTQGKANPSLVNKLLIEELTKA